MMHGGRKHKREETKRSQTERCWRLEAWVSSLRSRVSRLTSPTRRGLFKKTHHDRSPLAFLSSLAQQPSRWACGDWAAALTRPLAWAGMGWHGDVPLSNPSPGSSRTHAHDSVSNWYALSSFARLFHRLPNAHWLMQLDVGDEGLAFAD